MRNGKKGNDKDMIVFHNSNQVMDSETLEVAFFVVKLLFYNFKNPSQFLLILYQYKKIIFEVNSCLCVC